jgi:hypothetical protein
VCLELQNVYMSKGTNYETNGCQKLNAGDTTAPVCVLGLLLHMAESDGNEMMPKPP